MPDHEPDRDPGHEPVDGDDPRVADDSTDEFLRWAGDGPPWFSATNDDTLRLMPDLPREAAVELVWVLSRLRERVIAGDVPPVPDLDAGGVDIWDIAAIAVVRLAELNLDGLLDEDAMAEWVEHVHNLGVITTVAVEGQVGGTPGPDGELARMAEFLDRLTEESEAAMARRITRRRDGLFRLKWSADDRAVIATLAAELETMLGSGDETLTRLFPPAYGLDLERSRDYAAVADHELMSSRRATLAVVAESIQMTVVDEDQLSALMRAVNDIRLVIGTRLDISEEDSFLDHLRGPDAEIWIVYERLLRLQHEIIQALRATL